MKLRTYSKTGALVQLAGCDDEKVSGQFPVDQDTGNQALQVRNEVKVSGVSKVSGKKEDLYCSEGVDSVFLNNGDTHTIYTVAYSATEGAYLHFTGNLETLETLHLSAEVEPETIPETFSGSPETFQQITITVLPGRYDPTHGKPSLPKELWCYGLEWAQAEPLHTHYKQRYFAALSIQDGKYCIEGKL